MSLDLSWELLDEHFAGGLVERLNGVLASASRPDYLGPITLSNLTLGSDAPEVGIANVGDVWPEFLQREEGHGGGRGTSHARPSAGQGHPSTSVLARERAYDKASRRKDRHVSPFAPPHHASLARFADKNLPFARVPGADNSLYDDNVDLGWDVDGLEDVNPSARYPSGSERPRIGRKKEQQFRTYRQYSDSGRLHRVETGSMTSGYNDTMTPWSMTNSGTPWGAGLPAQAASQTGGYFSAWQGAHTPSVLPSPLQDTYLGPSLRSSRMPSWQRQSSASSLARYQGGMAGAPSSHTLWDDTSPSHLGVHEMDDLAHDGGSADQSSSLPSLQLQLSLHWETQSLRLSLETSLLINHPSPAFMSLPLTITITGLALQAGGLLAFEVDPISSVRRAHFCLVVEEEDDEFDTTGVGQAAHREDARGTAGDTSLFGLRDVSSTNAPTPAPATSATSATRPGVAFGSQLHRAPQTSALNTPYHQGGSGGAGQEGEPSPGERILYNVKLETSVGQADKHVLKNVAKVERFVVTLVRKAISDEVSACWVASRQQHKLDIDRFACSHNLTFVAGIPEFL